VNLSSAKRKRKSNAQKGEQDMGKLATRGPPRRESSPKETYNRPGEKKRVPRKREKKDEPWTKSITF